ncbi:MAG: apolipoprotein N-acyltransferase [Rhabdochlamydiaceae bacterium]
MKNFLLVIVSWVVVSFGQPAWVPFLAPISACLGYGLFWRALLKIPSRKRRFWLAAGWFCLVQMIQLSWMTSTEFQGLYILAVYAVLCLLLGLQFGAVSACIDRIPYIAVASIWTLIEWARLYFFCGFSWNPLGLTLTAFTPSMQMASIFGILGLSFWVVITNLAVVKKKWTAWGALALFPYIFGWGHIFFHAADLENSRELSVALVQTGLLPSQKTLINERESEFIPFHDQWRNILTLLKENPKKVDLIVLPEYAVPLSAELGAYSFETTRHILQDVMKKDVSTLLPQKPPLSKVSNSFWVRLIADVFSAEVVVGLDARDGRQHFSSAFHVLPHNLQVNRYDKQILVPLAEYLPFSWLKKLTSRYGITEFFTHGKESKVFLGKVPLSISICYEETFSHLIREGRLKGAELLVNATNDNWYPASHLSRQHFDHARIRTVENGVPMVRACNTGVTAAIDSLGRTLGKITDERKAGVLVAQVPLYHYPTLFTFWGNFGILSVCVGFLGLSYWKSRKYPSDLTCTK